MELLAVASIRSGNLIGIDRAGTVDSLPFGMAGVHVHEGAKPDPASGSVAITEAELEAARKSRTVVRQGTFTGAHEVKA